MVADVLRRIGELGAVALLLFCALGCRQTVLIDDARDGGGAGPDAASPFCPGGEARRLTFAIEKPEVIVAIDRSSSMNATLGESTRVGVARDVIEEAVRRYQTVARFGHVEFPGRPCSEGSSCCEGDVTPPTSSFDAFQTALRGCAASGAGCANSAQRPIAAALDAARITFGRLERAAVAPDRRAVVLLTDGPPSCGSEPCSETFLEASLLAQNDILTYVVTVGTPPTSDCLQRLARFGLTEAAAGTSPETLKSVVGTILGDISRTACRVDVSSPPADDETVALLQGGVPLPYDERDGWDFDDGSMLTITLHGSACQLLLDKGPESFDLRACRPAQ